MAGRLPVTGRIREVTARRGEVRDLDGERESLETKDGERESLETKDGDRESLETKDGERESLETKHGERERMETSRARQECRVQKRDNGTPLDFGLSRELWTGRGSATSQQWSGTQACHKRHGNQRDCSSGWSIDGKRFVKDKRVNQEARTLDPEWRDQRAVRKREITVSGSPI